MNPAFIIAACRVLLGFVFLVACIHKILFPEIFALSVYQYQLLPDTWVNSVAITLPWIELVAALAVIGSPRFKDGAALLMLVMLAVFAGAMMINIFRGLDVACGCFSTDPSEAIGWTNVVRNVGYMFIAMVVLLEQPIRKRLGYRPSS